MITFIVGGHDSGKSAFAEELACKDACKGKYYIATMTVADEDSARRRDKHVMMRDGKGFETLEIPYHIEVAPELMREPKDCVVLLECVANLVGNAMHDDEWKMRLHSPSEETKDDIVFCVVRLVRKLADAVGHLIVVSLRCDEEDTKDEETALYISLLEAVNARLSRIANNVYER